MCFLLLAAASLSCATTAFAQVTSAHGPRIGQIAAKFVF
jgi:hypothetical protein